MSRTKAGETTLATLERWSPRLFLAGGALFLLGAVNDGLIYFAGASNPEALSVVFLVSGLTAAMVGLVGLYPDLSDRTPNLATSGLGSVGLTVAGMVVLATMALLSLALPALNLFGTAVVPLVALPTGLLLVAAFLLFGVAVLRTTAFPRAVGGLLLAEVVLMAFVIAGPTEALDRGVFLVGAKLLHVTILGSIGYLLRARPRQPARDEVSPA